MRQKGFGRSHQLELGGRKMAAEHVSFAAEWFGGKKAS